MKMGLLAGVIGIVVLGTATALPFCVIPLGRAQGPTDERVEADASPPTVTDLAASSAPACDPATYVQPLTDAWISEC